MKPTIGITLAYDKGERLNPGVNYAYIRKEYGRQVAAAGGTPIFLDESISPQAAAALCQGIVLSGGEDIDSTLYGQARKGSHRQEPRKRTDWERALITACDKRNVPILGICYGLQLLNVHYGGDLSQDIAGPANGAPNHGTARAAVTHNVAFAQPFLGFQPGQPVATAHRHHQAVHNLALGFRVAARAADGTIEAIAGRGHFGVQWHAESDGTASTIYREFVKKCRRSILPRTWSKSWDQVRAGTAAKLSRGKAKTGKKR